MQLSIRRWRVLIAIVAALGALAFGVSSPAHAAVTHTVAHAAPFGRPTPAVATATLARSLWDNGFGNPTFSLHAHAHNEALTTCHGGCTAQAWDATSCTTVRLWNGDGVFVCQLHLIGTNECANWVSNGNSFYLDSCVSGDASELFEYTTVEGTNTTILNVAASDAYRAYMFFSAYYLGEGSPIAAETASQQCSGCAIWYYA